MNTSVSSGLLRRLGIDIRPSEVALAASLFAYFFLIGTVQFTGKTVRQSSFVDALGSDKLPIVYLAVALFSLPLLRVYERFTDHVSHYRLMVGTLVACAVTMVAFWWLYGFPWTSVRFVYYVWISLATVLLVSQFWSYTNHLFDPREARRLFGFIGAGGLLGGVAGGLLASLASRDETRLALLVGAVLLVAAALLLVRIERTTGHGEVLATSPQQQRLQATRGGLEAIRRSPHLQVIAALMVLSVMVAQIVDLQFNWAIEEAVDGLDERTFIFGTVFAVMGLSAFLFQLLITARIHRTLGVGFAMRVLPVSVAAGTMLLLLAGNPFLLLPAVWLVSGLRVTEAGLRYSLDQATREILFVPVPENERTKAKAFIDVLVQRFARGAAALLLLTVTVGFLTPVQAGWFTIALVVVWIVVTIAAQRQYVTSLRRGLDFSPVSRRSAQRLELLDPNDVTTLEVLVQSLGSADPGQVLHSLDLLAAHGRGRLVNPLLLYHDDPSVKRRTLEVLEAEGRRDALPLIERLLGDPDLDVRVEAIRALAVLSQRAGPQMMRQRLQDADLRVRSAAIACLAEQGTEEDVARAEETLVELLTDAEPTARAEGAKALSNIDEPRFQEYLVQLLYDSETSVVKHAIDAVRRRVGRAGNCPLYVPILISLLRHRRLKHEAREALVACGEQVIPALIHFMNDPHEETWVRRGLPKTIARLSTASAKRALLQSLEASDPFLRGKVIEALASLGDLEASGAAEVERQILQECRSFFVCLIDLLSLSNRQDLRLAGPNVVWRREPSLLQELLADRMRNHLYNIFGLLSLTAPGQDIWGAYQRLIGDHQTLRNHALEYLDNILGAAVRRPVLAVIDDLVLVERLRLGRRLFGLQQGDEVATLRRLIQDRPEGDSDAAWITAAALHAVWTKRVERLYETVRTAAEASDSLVQETAEWVEAALRRGRAEPA